MEKTQLFSAIAEFYDYSMRKNCDYEGWADYVLNVIKSHCSSMSKGIDVGCGSGYFTRKLKKAGFNVTGMDISSEMLTSAQQLTTLEGLYIPYIKGDMTKLKSLERVDFITAINDGINYVPNDLLLKTFKSFSDCLKKGGLLHFDISSEFKLKNIIADNTFCEDDDDYSYIWFNKPYEDRVVMEMSIFLRDGKKYIKKESVVTEYIHNIKTIKNALENSNFEIISIAGEKGKPYSEKEERVNFTAVKK